MQTRTQHTAEVHRPTDAARVFATVFGIAFLAVGIAGFVPGVTTHWSQLDWAGHDSGAELLGLFRVSVLHNVVHLVFGVVGLIAARTARSRTYLIGGGGVYAVLFLYGMAIEKGSSADFVPLNRADDWLHLGLAAAMVLAGLLTLPRRRGDSSTPRVT